MADGPKRARKFFLPIHNNTDFLQPVSHVPVDLTKHTRNSCFQRRRLRIIVTIICILVLIGGTIPLSMLFLNTETADTPMPSKPFSKSYLFEKDISMKLYFNS